VEAYLKFDPLNLSLGKEIIFTEIVALINDLFGFEGELIWDRSKPDGRPPRRLYVSRAKQDFDWGTTTGLEEDIRRIID
jgi:nucleoside-diphosphate-sugar epimerase